MPGFPGFFFIIPWICPEIDEEIVNLWQIGKRNRVDSPGRICYNEKNGEGGERMAKGVSNYDLQVDIARGIFLEYDQAAIIRKFSLEADENWIYLDYLNTPCRISRQTGAVEEYREQWRECRSFGTVMTLYDLLCYPKGDRAPMLHGRWCTVGNFVITGVTQTGGFTGKYAKVFDCRREALAAACEQLGGVVQPSMAGADLTCRFSVTDFFPVLLQFWESDEEFPSKLMLLWDGNSMEFLHFETTFYLQGDILERLQRFLEGRL